MKTRHFFFLIIFFVSFTSLEAQKKDEQNQLLDKVKSYISDNKGIVYQTIANDITSGETNDEKFRLNGDRTYRIFFVAQGALSEYDVSLRADDKRKFEAETTECLGVPVYTWEVQTFRPTYCTLSIAFKANKGGNKRHYWIIVASVGKTMEELTGCQNPPRGVDSQGHVYEVLNGEVFKDGKKYYKSSRYYVTGLYISKKDKVYLLTKEGEVIRDLAVIFLSSRRNVIKIAGNDDGKVFFLCHDGVVLQESGAVVYKRNGKYKAVDILEEGGNVLILTAEGKRVELN